MMMNHHTRFGYKRLTASEDILWTKPNTWKDRQTHMAISVYSPHFVTAGGRKKETNHYGGQAVRSRNQ